MHELHPTKSYFDLERSLPRYLDVGTYPEVILQENKHKAIERLHDIAHNYLFKDIFLFE